MEKKQAEDTFRHLFNTPVDRHVALVLNRHKKDDRIFSLANLGTVGDFRYLDTVYLSYEKASGASSATFTPLCEAGFVFYKGEAPDVKKTGWYSDEQSNATNLWQLAPNEAETRQATYYGRFSHEVGLLLYSLTKPSSTRRFIYGLDSYDDNLFAFCHHYKLGGYLYTDSAAEAKEIIDNYHKYVERKTYA